MDDRHGDVLVVRPMRDYTAKEIAFYNHFFSVPTIAVPPLFTKVGPPLVPRGGDPNLRVLTAARPSLSLAPPAPGEAQHPPLGRTLPPGASGRLPLHHQHSLPVWHSGVRPPGGCGGEWAASTQPPPPQRWVQDRREAEPRSSQGELRRGALPALPLCPGHRLG